MRPFALRGPLWVGDGTAYADGVVVVGAGGRVERVGPALGPLPDETTAGGWVGPALCDAHVHLAFGGYDAMLAGGVGAVRDLGAPLADALSWRSPAVTVAGPVLTAPGGYPSGGWGAKGFAWPVASPAEARAAVRELAAAGVDLIKLALEPAGGQPVPDPVTCGAVVQAAHQAGLAVTAHALSAAMVSQALDAGVDELAHVPVERLPARLVDKVAASGVRVVSTIETLSTYAGSAVVKNAAALHRAGVPLAYGTDLGNAGTRPGADPRELARLAATGLGPAGALRAATRPIRLGEPARLVLLERDPLVDPAAWLRPLLTVSGRSARAGARR